MSTNKQYFKSQTQVQNTKQEKHLLLMKTWRKSKVSCDTALNFQFTGDSVHYKCMNSKKWHRLAKIFGQDGEQQQVKIETNYIRVHPCCHQLIQKNSNYRQLSMPELNN